jgi:hypothetical protein
LIRTIPGKPPLLEAVYPSRQPKMRPGPQWLTAESTDFCGLPQIVRRRADTAGPGKSHPKSDANRLPRNRRRAFPIPLAVSRSARTRRNVARKMSQGFEFQSLSIESAHRRARRLTAEIIAVDSGGGMPASKEAEHRRRVPHGEIEMVKMARYEGKRTAQVGRFAVGIVGKPRPLRRRHGRSSVGFSYGKDH